MRALPTHASRARLARSLLVAGCLALASASGVAAPATAATATLDQQPPTPRQVAVSPTSPSTATVSWEVDARDPAPTFEVELNGEIVEAPDLTTTSFVGLNPCTAYTVRVRSLDLFGNPSSWSEPKPFKTLPECPNPVAAPTDLVVVGEPRPRATTLSWTPPADLTDFDHYEVTYDETVRSVTEPRITLPRLVAESDYFVTVVVVTKSGQVSEPISVVFVTLLDDVIDECEPPTSPGHPYASNLTETSATLTWEPAFHAVGVAAYDVYDGTDQIATTEAPTTTLTGLSPDTSYAITVRARSAFVICEASVPSAILYFKTLPRDAGTAFSYTANGSATLKGLTRGAIPLKGKVDLLRFRSTSQGSITLEPTKARLVALGFIPVTASVQFVSSGPTTTTLTAASGLRLSTKTRIKLPQVSLFGTVPLAGGTTCQTREPADLELSSPTFTAESGGRLTGSFAVSDLAGCGVLNGLVSPATASTGNPISLDLEPTR